MSIPSIEPNSLRNHRHRPRHTPYNITIMSPYSFTQAGTTYDALGLGLNDCICASRSTILDRRLHRFHWCCHRTLRLHSLWLTDRYRWIGYRENVIRNRKSLHVHYLYISLEHEEKHGRDIFRVLVWQCEQKKIREVRCDWPDDMLHLNLFDLIRWLHQQLSVPLDPKKPSLIDLHFIKCAGKEYKYQDCRAPNNSDHDICDNPDIWKPPNQEPDYFGKDQLISKMCCCKSNYGRRPTLPPRQ
jgi:hypothetical protein